MLNKKEVESWKTKGFVICRNLLNVEECIKSMEIEYPSNKKNPILDFGSNGSTEFPCKYNSINKITVHKKLIKCVEQLLNTEHILLSQSIAWAKYGIVTNDIQANNDQRIHMDYGNNTWLHPPKWEHPNAVAAIIYYSNTEETGGSTALVERNGNNDEVYSYPYVHMPGIANKPFFNNKDAAEKSVSGKTKYIREKCYEREIKPHFKPGDVLFYRLDLWHRGTPVNIGKVRYVHNLLWIKKDALGFNIWNKGWTQNMYYGWLENFVSNLNNKQRSILNFPNIKKLPKYLQEAVYARYPNMSKL